MNLPDLKYGYDRQYRIWTVEHLPVDRLPRYERAPLSPAAVTHDGWFVLIEDGHLYVHRDGVQHEIHDTSYASDQDAERAAYGAGVLAVLVYEENAASYGFPVA